MNKVIIALMLDLLMRMIKKFVILIFFVLYTCSAVFPYSEYVYKNNRHFIIDFESEQEFKEFYKDLLLKYMIVIDESSIPNYDSILMDYKSVSSATLLLPAHQLYLTNTINSQLSELRKVSNRKYFLSIDKIPLGLYIISFIDYTNDDNPHIKLLISINGILIKPNYTDLNILSLYEILTLLSDVFNY